MGIVSSPVRAAVSRIGRGGVAEPFTYRPGIHLDFARGLYYAKVPGGAVTRGALSSLFTFTGGNQSMYMGPAGLLVASATNTPRIEYDANGNCLGLLMEAARTNLVIQSADLTAYTLTNVTIGGNAIAAPDGTTTADSITETVTSGLHRAQSTSIGVANVANTFSCFVKAGLRTKGRILLGGTSGSTIANFDLVAVTATPVPSGNGTCTAATITALANGWFRVTATGVPDSTSGSTFAPRIDLADDTFTFSYAGNAGSVGLYAWGLQAEAAAFASSYIPTTTVSVARTADSCIRTLGSEFSATAGTVAVIGRASGGQDAAAGQNTYSFDDLTGNNRFNITRPVGSNVARFVVTSAAANQAVLDATWVNSTAFKHAAAWAANDFAASFNGAAVLTDAAGSLPTVTTLGLGVLGSGLTAANGHIRRFDYYPERKPNGFLVSVST